jgi:coenzyme PQQ precursor peptide PqqA
LPVGGRPEGGQNRAAVELNGGTNRMWTKPEYTEMRFGFEVTMYIATR